MFTAQCFRTRGLKQGSMRIAGIEAERVCKRIVAVDSKSPPGQHAVAHHGQRSNRVFPERTHPGIVAQTLPLRAGVVFPHFHLHIGEIVLLEVGDDRLFDLFLRGTRIGTAESEQGARVLDQRTDPVEPGARPPPIDHQRGRCHGDRTKLSVPVRLRGTAGEQAQQQHAGHDRAHSTARCTTAGGGDALTVG